MARSRNRPPPLRWLIVVALVILAAVLCARAEAAPEPPPDEEGAWADPCDGDDCTVAAVPPGPQVAPFAGVPCPPGEACVIRRHRWWRGPPPLAVDDVVHAAVRAAGLADDPAPGWRVRARLGGLVPWLSVRAGRDDTWREVQDPTLGHTSVFLVSATWRLDRLAFDPNEIRIAAIDVSRRRERRHVGATTIHDYYLWLATGSDEVRAELDAETDGWFSRALAKAQKPE